MKLAILSFITLASCQTISQYLLSRPELSKVAAAISQNPLWSDASKTNVAVFVPVDSGNTMSGKRPGTITVVQTINFNDANNYHYTVLRDTNVQVIFDNYDNQAATPVNVHMRYGTGETMVTGYFKASNGQVFIMANAIPDDASIMTVLSSSADFSALVALINTNGLAAQVNAMTGVTFLAPENAALATIGTTYNTKDKVSALLQAHFITSVVTSNAVSPGGFPSFLGPAITLAVSGTEGLTANGVMLGMPADIFAANSVIQPLTKLLVPATLVPVAWPGAVIVAPVATTVVQPVSTPASTGGSGATPVVSPPASSQPKKDASSGGMGLFAGAGVLFLSTIYVVLM